jgi:hypothetical protein
MDPNGQVRHEWILVQILKSLVTCPQSMRKEEVGGGGEAKKKAMRVGGGGGTNRHFLLLCTNSMDISVRYVPKTQIRLNQPALLADFPPVYSVDFGYYITNVTNCYNSKMLTRT